MGGPGQNQEAKRLLVQGIGGLAGGLIGFAVAGPAGIQKGVAWGLQGGSLLGRVLFPTMETPKVLDAQVQMVSYGVPIPIVYGTMRLSGNVIWTSAHSPLYPSNWSGSGGPLRGTRDTEGKGGRLQGSFVGLDSDETQEPEYEISLAIAFCEGPIGAIKSIWANGTKIWSSIQGERLSGAWADNIRIYKGDETQTPDPLIEGIEGVGNVPAYRGICYIVITGLQLHRFGNSVPNFSAEITSVSSAAYPLESVTVPTGVAEDNFYVSKLEPFLYSIDTNNILHKIDVGSRTIVDSVDLVTLIEAMPIDMSDPTGASISDFGGVVAFGKIIVDQGNDSIYIPCQLESEESFLVKLTYLLTVFAHNFTNRKPTTSMEWDGLVIGYGTNDQQKIFTVDKETEEITGYFTPVTSNGKKFVQLFTHAGPSASGHTGTWVPGNMTQDQRGFIWLVYYDESQSDCFVLTRFDTAGQVIHYLFTGTSYRSRHVCYNGYDDTLVLYGGEGKIIKVNGYRYPFTPAVDLVSSTTNMGAGYQRANVLSHVKTNTEVLHVFHNTGASAAFQRIKMDDLTLDTALSYDMTLWGLSAADVKGGGYDPHDASYWLSSVSDGKYYQIKVNIAASGPVTVGEVVTDILLRAGLDVGTGNEYDLTQIEDELSEVILGYTLARVVTAKIALEPLMQAFFFDAAEVDGQMRVKKRTGLPLSGGDLRFLYADPTLNDSFTGSQLSFNAGTQIITNHAGGTDFTTLFDVDDLIEISGSASDGWYVLLGVTSTTLHVQGVGVSLGTEAVGTPRTLQSHRVFPLPEDQMGVREYGSPPISKFIENQVPESDLPRVVNVNYAHEGRGYDLGTQHFQRNIAPLTKTTGARKETTVELAISMTPDYARTLAKRLLLTAWSERFQYEIHLGPRWLLFSPMDVIQVLTGNGLLSSLRLHNKMQGGGNYIQADSFLLDDLTIYERVSTGFTGLPISYSVPITAPSLTELMDTHIVRGIDDNPGYYVAAAPATSGVWEGVKVSRSANDDSYRPVVGITQASVIGVVTSVLGDDSPSNSFDETTTLTVKLLYGTLSSATELEVLNGANLALVGDEFIQFKTATLVGGGIYTLSGLLRYRYGTDPYGSTHVRGERFVLFEDGKIKRVLSLTSEWNLTRPHRGITHGLHVPQTRRIDFTNTGKSMMPYAPAPYPGYFFYDYGKQHIHLSFMRRPRYSGEWMDYVDVPQVEVEEKYEADVYKADGTFLRTLSGTNPNMTAQELFSADGALVYTLAMQVADLGAAAVTEQIYFKIYQIGITNRRGYPLTVTWYMGPP